MGERLLRKKQKKRISRMQYHHTVAELPSRHWKNVLAEADYARIAPLRNEIVSDLSGPHVPSSILRSTAAAELQSNASPDGSDDAGNASTAARAHTVEKD